MSAESTLAGAIAGLIGEKRALGYKYVSEERVLAQFEAFCASEFPCLEMVRERRSRRGSPRRGGGR